MKRFILASALAALVLAPGAAADIRIGVADDHPKSPDIAGRFYDTMKDVGLSENRVTIVWDSSRPTAIENEAGVANAIDAAAADGVKLTLALYPSKARALVDSGAQAKFAAWTGLVARAFPQVKDIIVGNEPNKSRFWQPQFLANGRGAACAAYEPVLAASYDAIKNVDRSIAVIGIGLGPRGTDNPRAPGNLSISPVRCIRDIGRAYRKSRRKKPIMDALSYHPYPNASTDKLETGYSWPNAGIPNLDRIKQAVWDAFNGTAQPTFPEAGMPGGPLRTLKLRLNEVGWQVAIPPASRDAYFGKESVVTTDEGTQAARLREPDPVPRVRPRSRVGPLLQPRRRGEPRPLAVRPPARGLDEAAVVRDRQGLDRGRAGALQRAPGAVAARVQAGRGPSRLPRRHAAALGAEHVLELRRRKRRGDAVHGRPVPRDASGEGDAVAAGTDLTRASQWTCPRRVAEVERQGRRGLGQGDHVPGPSG